MKRFLSSVCVLCALLLWTGCAAQAPASSFAPASAPEAQSLPSAPPAASSLPTETPPYTGPLYEVTVEALPEAAEITFPSAAYGIFRYEGQAPGTNLCLGVNGAPLNTYGGALAKAMGVSDDYYLFRLPYEAWDALDSMHYITDHDGNVMVSIPEKIWFADGFDLAYDVEFTLTAAEGFLAYYDSEADEYGLLNLATGEYAPIDETYVFSRNEASTELPTVDWESSFWFSEGLIPVQYRDTEHCHIEKRALDLSFGSGDNVHYGYVYEGKYAGFLDHDGELVFAFSDIPDFEGRMVTGVSGYRDGVCIVATRSLDPAEVTGPYDVYEGGYYEDTTWYRIDRAGAVLGESTKEEFSEYRDALTDRGIHLHDAVYSGENEFGPVPTRVQSVVVAEGLIARADGSDVVLEDANGTVYPIELPEGCRAVNVFGADGMAWILLSENRDSVYGMGSDFYTHIVRLRSIMPEDYVVPDAFAQRGAVLDYEAAELPPLPKPEEGGAQSGELGSHAIDEEEMDDLLEIPEEERRMHEQVLIAFENLAREQQMDAGNPTAAILRLRLKM